MSTAQIEEFVTSPVESVHVKNISLELIVVLTIMYYAELLPTQILTFCCLKMTMNTLPAQFYM